MNLKTKIQATENTESTERAAGFLCDLCVLCGYMVFSGE